jgi:hypothetical protein
MECINELVYEFASQSVHISEMLHRFELVVVLQPQFFARSSEYRNLMNVAIDNL